MKQENPPLSWVMRTHFSRAVYHGCNICVDTSHLEPLSKPQGPTFAGKRLIKSPAQSEKGLVFIASTPSLEVYYQVSPVAPPSKLIDDNKKDSMDQSQEFSFTFNPSAVLCAATRVCESIPDRSDNPKGGEQDVQHSFHGFFSTSKRDLLSKAPPGRSLSAHNLLSLQENSQIWASNAVLQKRTLSKRVSPRGLSPPRTPRSSSCTASAANSPRHSNRLNYDRIDENSQRSSSITGTNQGPKVSTVRRDMSRALSWSDHLTCASGNERAVLSAENQMIDLSQLFLGERFASGTHSRIYHGKYRDSAVAVKVIRKPDEDELLGERLERSFVQEVTILSCLEHHNVVKFIAACKKPPVLCIVTEYLCGGSIRAFLHKREGQPLPIAQVLRMALDIAYGMEYLHMKGVVHRDLKSENLVLCEDGRVKILDFGVACFESACNSCGDDLGTYRWMAPEMLSKKPYTRKVDVYSFGIVLWELLTGHLPYEDMGAVQAAFSVVHENMRPPVPPNCPAPLKDLMCHCWSADPEERPEFWEILRLLNLCMESIPINQEDGSESDTGMIMEPCSII